MKTAPRPDPQRLSYTVAEVIKMSGFGRSTVLKQIDVGALPVIRIGRRVMIRISDFEAWFSPRVENPADAEGSEHAS